MWYGIFSCNLHVKFNPACFLSIKLGFVEHVWGEGIAHSLALQGSSFLFSWALPHSWKGLTLCLPISSLSSSRHLHIKCRWSITLILIMLCVRKVGGGSLISSSVTQHFLFSHLCWLYQSPSKSPWNRNFSRYNSCQGKRRYWANYRYEATKLPIFFSTWWSKLKIQVV